MAKLTYDQFAEKMTKQPTYFKYPMEDAVLRSEPNGAIYVKFKGKEEFKARPNSGVVAEAIRQHQEITKQDYDSFK